MPWARLAAATTQNSRECRPEIHHFPRVDGGVDARVERRRDETVEEQMKVLNVGVVQDAVQQHHERGPAHDEAPHNNGHHLKQNKIIYISLLFCKITFKGFLAF